MEPEQNDFQQLRRLLALKRHEQPPPGYFDQLPRQVLARIRAGDRGAEESLFDRLAAEAPALRRLWALFETKPILAGVFAAGLCVLLISGIVFTESSQPMPVSPLATVEQTSQPALAAVSQPSASSLFTPAAAVEPRGVEGGALQPSQSLFQEVRQKQNQELWFNVSVQPAAQTVPAPTGN